MLTPACASPIAKSLFIPNGSGFPPRPPASRGRLEASRRGPHEANVNSDRFRARGGAGTVAENLILPVPELVSAVYLVPLTHSAQAAKDRATVGLFARVPSPVGV